MPKIRNIIIFVVIAILLVLGYLFFTKSSSTPPTLVSSAPVGTSTSSATATSGATANSSIAQNFLALLLNVSNIKLDDSIFSDPAFASLHDSTIVLAPDGTQGRPNPFAQFGTDVVTPTNPSSPATSLPTSTVPVLPTNPKLSAPSTTIPQ